MIRGKGFIICSDLVDEVLPRKANKLFPNDKFTPKKIYICIWNPKE